MSGIARKVGSVFVSTYVSQESPARYSLHTPCCYLDIDALGPLELLWLLQTPSDSIGINATTLTIHPKLLADDTTT